MSEELKPALELELGDEEISEELHLRQMAAIVREAAEEEELLSTKLHDYVPDDTWREVVSDAITEFSGSWKFILGLVAIISIWMLFLGHVDPFPFILLNLAISVICVLQSPFILMNQWRKEERDRIRAEQEYMINMKAEIEVRTLLKQQEQVLKLLRKIDKKL